jgi:hypothetical protein
LRTSAEEHKHQLGEKLGDNIYEDKALTTRLIYRILKQIKAGENTGSWRKFSSKKKIHTIVLIVTVSAFVVDIEEIAGYVPKALPQPMENLLAPFLFSL